MMTEDEARKKWPIMGRKKGHSKGYIRVLCPTHPNAGSDGYVYEHVYIMTVELGRHLVEPEQVHHIDCNTANNHPKNLQLTTQSEHQRLHAAQRDRKSTRPSCQECGQPIHYASKTMLCAKHYWIDLRSNRTQCLVGECDEVAGHRSGLCRQHVRFRANKRRYQPKWDFFDAN